MAGTTFLVLSILLESIIRIRDVLEKLILAQTKICSNDAVNLTFNFFGHKPQHSQSPRWRRPGVTNWPQRLTKPSTPSDFLT